MYGYGTSIPPNNNEIDENEETSTRKVIFCVHGKLSGCCTVAKGVTSIEETAPAAIVDATATATGVGSVDYQQTLSSKNRKNLCFRDQCSIVNLS